MFNFSNGTSIDQTFHCSVKRVPVVNQGSRTACSSFSRVSLVVSLFCLAGVSPEEEWPSPPLVVLGVYRVVYASNSIALSQDIHQLPSPTIPS